MPSPPLFSRLMRVSAPAVCRCERDVAVAGRLLSVSLLSVFSTPYIVAIRFTPDIV